MWTQARWRAVGAGALVCAALLAWAGVHWDVLRQGVGVACIFAAGLVCLLAFAFYIALLDLRYIKAEYMIARREIFRQTLGDEEFRKVIRVCAKGTPQAGTSDVAAAASDDRRNLN